MIKADCVIGVELELEGVLNPVSGRNPIFDKYWNIIHDGSLRSAGVELVLKRPLSPAGLSTALHSMDKYVRDLDQLPTTGQCTSTHIHIDVSNSSVKELLMFLFTYRLFEQTLINYCGEYRKGNLYCLTFKEAGLGFQNIENVLKNPRFIQNFNQDYDKYGACNLAAIPTYGSLEFRMKGGSTTKAEVAEWINILACIKTFSQQVDTLDQLMYLSSESTDSLLNLVFGDLGAVLEDHFDRNDIFEACMDIQYVTNDFHK